MSKSSETLSYYIHYGLLGGASQSKQLRSLLKQVGFVLASKSVAADIVIAHSAGCWQIDQAARPKLVVYIGMPLASPNPKTSFRSNFAILTGCLRNGHPLRYVAINLWNIYYGTTQFKRNAQIIRHASKSVVRVFPSAQSVMLVNRTDPWPESPKKIELTSKKPWAFVSLPGSHDNIWEEPEKYSEIIEYYAGLLA
jgi:hypothetical protein